jgi:hypothetical protein
MRWMMAENMSLELGLSHGDCAEYLKQYVLAGRLAIDFDAAGDRVRLIPAPSLATN